ncbi:hypothetical protein H1C71_004649, partial [Ictidomys tridecemlineatus]
LFFLCLKSTCCVHYVHSKVKTPDVALILCPFPISLAMFLYLPLRLELGATNLWVLQDKQMKVNTLIASILGPLQYKTEISTFKFNYAYIRAMWYLSRSPTLPGAWSS